MLKKPLVSVIIPCYNQGDFLNDCLNSVFNQTYKDWECIIVNDGSTDNTETIAQSWCKKDPRIKYVYKINGGLSSARNAGLKICEGDYIQLLDSDDILESDKIISQANFLESLSDVDIVYGSSRYFKDGNINEKFPLGVNGMVPSIDLDALDEQLYCLLFRNICTICAPLYRKSVFHKVGFFDEDLKALEDWYFHICCSFENIKFHFLKQQNSYCLIRIHSDSMMRNEVLIRDNYSLFRKKVHYMLQINPYKFPWEIPDFSPVEIRKPTNESLRLKIKRRLQFLVGK